MIRREPSFLKRYAFSTGQRKASSLTTQIRSQDDPGENFYMVFRGQGTIPHRLFDTPQDILKSIVLWIPVEIRQRERRGSIDALGKKPVTQHITFLEAGDSFGERALLYESDRRAGTSLPTTIILQSPLLH
jgi:hypothetical protein